MTRHAPEVLRRRFKQTISDQQSAFSEDDLGRDGETDPPLPTPTGRGEIPRTQNSEPRTQNRPQTGTALRTRYRTPLGGLQTW